MSKMVVVKRYGSVKRFGARYGTKTRYRFGKIEAEQRKLHKCPYCNRIKVKRIAVGIWQCLKCNVKFVGKAYSIEKKVIFEEDVKEIQPEIKEELEKGMKIEVED